MTPSASYKIVFEDEWLIAVDKPSGLLVIETPKHEKNTLTRLINDYLDSKGIAANAYPCHRIDRETSGLVLYAKGNAVQKKMMDEFKNRRVAKAYLAFVHGIPKKSKDIIKSCLYNRNKRRNEPAITDYRVLEVRKDFSIVSVRPITGRTNQIRRHFKEIGHPILGERVYAFAKDYRLKFRRTALHARSLEFTHPATKERICLNTELPEDMRVLMMRWGGVSP